MAALLEMKQKIKELYGKNEVYLLPVFKFVLALVYFTWINHELGFSSQLGSIFVVLILSLLCAILPVNSIILFGYVFIIGHCYVIGIEVAGFALLMAILIQILFLRFSTKNNLALVFTPIGFMLNVPAMVPIGAGLLGGPLTAAPAGCGVVVYYFVKVIKEQAGVLQGEEMEIPQKLKLILDSLIKNQEMWVTVAAFVIVVFLVYLLRTRSMDYAWRIGIVVGAVTYVLIMFAGGLFLDMDPSMIRVIITSVVSVILAIILEFFVFGGDYTRTEHMEYEDDDYFYYVKAVPKVSVTASRRKIKKINGTPQEPVQEKMPPLQESVIQESVPPVEDIPVENEILSPVEEVDFEKKLEESLKDL